MLPRTITADLCEEKKAASIFTILVQIQSISPIAAPLLGIAMLKATDWTGIFWLLGVCGILGAALVLGLVPESKPKDGSAKSGSAGFRDLLSCRRYWLMNASFAALSALLFGYIAYANFIYATIFGLEAEAFGAVFALNAVGMIGCGFASIAMLRRWALRKSLAAGFAALAASTALLTAASAVFPESALAQGAALFLMIASLGLIFGGLTSEVMFSVPAPLVGMASAVLGVVQYAAGALSGWIIGLLKPEALLPIALSMLVFALLAAAGWLAGCAVRKPESRSGEPVIPN